MEGAEAPEQVMAQESESSDPVYDITATIDLSESTNVDKRSTDGYVISGVGVLTYSGIKGNLAGKPLSDPNLTNGVLDFFPAANGKTFRITQSGVRMSGSAETKNGTVIIPIIFFERGTKDITLILEDIDLGQYAKDNSLYGYILLGDDSSVKILLGTDEAHPGIGSSYVRGSIRVAPGATLTIDSAGAPGSSTGSLTVTAQTADSSAIGGGQNAAAINSGNIIINGGTVNASQTIAESTGAAIGGGGYTSASTTTQRAGTGNVTINGGTVRATSNGRGAAIGGGGIKAYSAYAGAGNIKITGGVVVAANTGYGAAIGSGSTLYSDNVSAGGQARGGDYNITVTGGFVTAAADKGAALGSGIVGHGGALGNSRTVNIGSGAHFKAYAGGVNITSGSFTAFARPAIDIGTLSGDGYFVNARFANAVSSSAATTFLVRQDGWGPVIDTLMLPAAYRCFAYSTDGPRTDNISAGAADEAPIGGVVHDDSDKSLELFSINTSNGYAAHGDASYALLSVTLDKNAAIPPVYEEPVLTEVTITNIVKGDYADKTRPFLFTVYYYTDELGAAPAAPVGEYSFTLSHGQKVILEDIPSDIYIRIVMGESDEYIPAYKDSADADGAEGNDTGVLLTGDQPRTFDFENTMYEVVPTGISDSSAGFLSLLLVSVLLLALSVAGVGRAERVFLALRFFKLRLRKQRDLRLEDLSRAVESDGDSVA